MLMICIQNTAEYILQILISFTDLLSALACRHLVIVCHCVTGKIYLFLLILVGSEENPGRKMEKWEEEEEGRYEEGGKVDRKEEESEGNNEKLQNENHTISMSNNTVTETD